MTRVHDFDLARQLLVVAGPDADVIAAGQARLNAAIAAGTVGQPSLHRRPEGWGARRPSTRRQLAAACAVVAAAVVTAAALIALPPQTGGRIAAGHVTLPHGAVLQTAAVQAAVLDSVIAAGGDVLYIRRVASTTPGIDTQEWFWPATPAPGQRVHMLARTANGIEIADTFSAMARDQYTAGSAGPVISGTQLTIDPHARTWSIKHGQIIRPQLPQATSATLLRQDMTAGVWSVIGRSSLAGQRAIKLVTATGANGLHELLWINARTHLPMRQVKQNWNEPGTTLRYDIRYLPAAPALLAKLTPAIPASYQRVP